jgi:geranylgeranyl pyrophosphate synthase
MTLAPTDTPAGIDGVVARHATAFEAALVAHVDALRWPGALLEGSRYALFPAGKRVRPVVARMAAEAVGGEPALAHQLGIGIELIHNYSLVHDDLPCMDDDDERRGKPSTHKAFGEGMAVLIGDALLTEAFVAVASGPEAARLTRLLARGAGGAGMVGGQVLDVDPDPASSVAGLERLHDMKTGALFRVAAEGGAIAAGAPEPRVEALARYGVALGLLFQLTDDILDAEQDADSDGNSYLHHMSLDAVERRRDEVAAEAHASVEALGDRARHLRALVDRIARRDA